MVPRGRIELPTRGFSVLRPEEFFEYYRVNQQQLRKDSGISGDIHLTPVNLDGKL